MRIFKPLQLLAAAGVMYGLAHLLIYEFADPGDHFYQFMYARGWVQYATPAVACLVVALLLDRLSRYRWNRARFQALSRGEEQVTGQWAEQLESVGSTCEQYGPAAAAVRSERLAEEHGKRIDKTYGLISYVTCAIPALGLFGTLLGMSKSLFVAFGSGSRGSESMQLFVTALSTAMDTTVLAMACAIPLLGCAQFLGCLEHDLAEKYAAYVRERFGLDEALGADRNVQALEKELRRMSEKIAAEAKASFEHIVKDATAVCREALERAVASVLARQQRHDKTVADRIAAEITAGLGRSVEGIGGMLERQNGRLAEDMVQHVGRLEKALHNRTPEEILIRYQQNGHAIKR